MYLSLFNKESITTFHCKSINLVIFALQIKCSVHIETSQLKSSTNQLTGFSIWERNRYFEGTSYLIGTSVVKELIHVPNFFHFTYATNLWLNSVAASVEELITACAQNNDFLYIRGVLLTLPNIYDGALLQKYS